VSGLILAGMLSSCVTARLVSPEVGRLATQIGEQWKGEETEDAIFVDGTNVLPHIWKLEETEGYADYVYSRARCLARRLECHDSLSLEGVRHLYSGNLPVLNTNLDEAVKLVVPLLVPKGLKGEWKHEKTLITADGTRALVRCHAVFGTLDGQGWLLVFVKQQDVWVLTLIEAGWVS